MQCPVFLDDKGERQEVKEGARRKRELISLAGFPFLRVFRGPRIAAAGPPVTFLRTGHLPPLQVPTYVVAVEENHALSNCKTILSLS